MLHEFCAAHNVPHRNCGKLVVAHDVKQEAALEHLAENGRAAGVAGLRIVDRAEVRRREPHTEASAALQVPSTGIISAEDLVKTLARIASDQGANLLTQARVMKMQQHADYIEVTLTEGDPGDPENAGEETVEARCV